MNECCTGSSSSSSSNNNNNHDDIYSAVIIIYNRAIARVHSVHTMNTETAPGDCRPLDQANRLEPQARLYRQPVNRIHHRHLLSLLSPKADTHFTIPQRVEG